MKELIVDFFAANANIILFIHVLSAIVWVGGMIAIRFAVHPALQHIENTEVRLARTLELLENFFILVIPMIVLSVVTAGLMAIGLGFRQTGGFMYGMVHFKEAIWTIMTILFTIIYIRRNRAERAFLSGDIDEVIKHLAPISKFFIPANIFLGLIALFVGGILRGF